eukprot:scaffold12194_cov129-Cylindrotheca_fusiformis.AAC.4
MNLRTINTSPADIVAAMAFAASLGRTREGLLLPPGSQRFVEEKRSVTKLATDAAPSNIEKTAETPVADCTDDEPPPQAQVSVDDIEKTALEAFAREPEGYLFSDLQQEAITNPSTEADAEGVENEEKIDLPEKRHEDMKNVTDGVFVEEPEDEMTSDVAKTCPEQIAAEEKVEEARDEENIDLAETRPQEVKNITIETFIEDSGDVLTADLAKTRLEEISTAADAKEAKDDQSVDHTEQSPDEEGNAAADGFCEDSEDEVTSDLVKTRPEEISTETEEDAEEARNEESVNQTEKSPEEEGNAATDIVIEKSEDEIPSDLIKPSPEETTYPEVETIAKEDGTISDPTKTRHEEQHCSDLVEMQTETNTEIVQTAPDEETFDEEATALSEITDLSSNWEKGQNGPSTNGDIPEFVEQKHPHREADIEKMLDVVWNCSKEVAPRFFATKGDIQGFVEEKQSYHEGDVERLLVANMNGSAEVAPRVVGTESNVPGFVEQQDHEEGKEKLLGVKMNESKEVAPKVVDGEADGTKKVNSAMEMEKENDTIDNVLHIKSKSELQANETIDVSNDEYFRSAVSKDLFLIKLSLIGAFNEIEYDSLVESVCEHKAFVMTIVKRYDSDMLKTIEKPAIMIQEAMKASVLEREHAQETSVRAKRMAEIEARKKLLRLDLSDSFFSGEEDKEQRDAPPVKVDDSQMISDVPSDLEEFEVFDRFEPRSKRKSAPRTNTPSQSNSKEIARSPKSANRDHPDVVPRPTMKPILFRPPTETMASIRASVEKKYNAMPKPTASFDKRLGLLPSPSYTVEERPGMPAIIHVEDMVPANFAFSE